MEAIGKGAPARFIAVLKTPVLKHPLLLLRRHHALLVVLGHSRLLWLRFYRHQTMAVLIEGLESAFERFAGTAPPAGAPWTASNATSGARSVRSPVGPTGVWPAVQVEKRSLRDYAAVAR